MSRAPSNFRESDLKRALRSIRDAGEEATTVEIENKLIKIRLRNGDVKAVNSNINNDGITANPWDEVDLK
jgi:hypothetical protein